MGLLGATCIKITSLKERGNTERNRLVRERGRRGGRQSSQNTLEHLAPCISDMISTLDLLTWANQFHFHLGRSGLGFCPLQRKETC